MANMRLSELQPVARDRYEFYKNNIKNICKKELLPLYLNYQDLDEELDIVDSATQNKIKSTRVAINQYIELYKSLLESYENERVTNIQGKTKIVKNFIQMKAEEIQAAPVRRVTLIDKAFSNFTSGIDKFVRLRKQADLLEQSLDELFKNLNSLKCLALIRSEINQEQVVNQQIVREIEKGKTNIKDTIDKLEQLSKETHTLDIEKSEYVKSNVPKDEQGEASKQLREVISGNVTILNIQTAEQMITRTSNPRVLNSFVIYLLTKADAQTKSLFLNVVHVFDLNYPNIYGETILDLCLKNNNLDQFSLVLTQRLKEKLNSSILFQCIKSNNFQAMRLCTPYINMSSHIKFKHIIEMVSMLVHVDSSSSEILITDLSKMLFNIANNKFPSEFKEWLSKPSFCTDLLIEASQRGRSEIIELIAQYTSQYKIADPAILKDQGITAYEIAIESGHIKIAGELFSHFTMDRSREELFKCFHAVMTNNYEALTTHFGRWRANHQEDPNKIYDRDGLNLFHRAVVSQSTSLTIIEYLANYFDINEPGLYIKFVKLNDTYDLPRFSTFFYAAMENKIQLLECLLRKPQLIIDFNHYFWINQTDNYKLHFFVYAYLVSSNDSTREYLIDNIPDNYFNSISDDFEFSIVNLIMFVFSYNTDKICSLLMDKLPSDILQGDAALVKNELLIEICLLRNLKDTLTILKTRDVRNGESYLSSQIESLFMVMHHIESAMDHNTVKRSLEDLDPQTLIETDPNYATLLHYIMLSKYQASIKLELCQTILDKVVEPEMLSDLLNQLRRHDWGSQCHNSVLFDAVTVAIDKKQQDKPKLLELISLFFQSGVPLTKGQIKSFPTDHILTTQPISALWLAVYFQDRDIILLLLNEIAKLPVEEQYSIIDEKFPTKKYPQPVTAFFLARDKPEIRDKINSMFPQHSKEGLTINNYEITIEEEDIQSGRDSSLITSLSDEVKNLPQSLSS